MPPAGRILIGGHRGDGETDREPITSKPPENTLDSIRAAIGKGADLVEIDVMQCRGGTVVVIHSNELRRHVLHPQARGALDPARPYVSQYRLAELKKLRVGPNGDGEIPTLREVLALLAGYPAVTLNIEIKGRQVTDDTSPSPHISLVEALLQDIAFGGFPEDRIILSSFAESALREAMQRAPRIRRALIFTAATDRYLHRPVFPHIPDDASRYRTLTADLSALQQQLQFSCLHPEITSLNDGNMQAASQLRSPEGKPLSVNCWSSHEPDPHQAKAAIHHTIALTRRHHLPLGLMTNFITEMREVVDEFK